MHIVTIKIANFKSYREEAEFSFVALDSDYRASNTFSVTLDDGSVIRLLRTAVIYGANASGKSNLLLALKALRYMVVKSRDFDIDSKIPYEPFRLDHNTEDTRFELDFIIDTRRYRYRISFNAERFSEESLWSIRNGEEIKVFVNKEGSVEAHQPEVELGSEWFDDDQLWAKDYLPNHLFLSEIATKPKNGLQRIYSAINAMSVKVLQNEIDLSEEIGRVSATVLKDSNSEIFRRLGRLIRIADLGISGIDLRRHDDSEFKFPEFVPEQVRRQMIEHNRWEFITRHRNRNGEEVEFRIQEESTGTQYFLSLGSRILDRLESGGVMVNDEMDLATHPQLFRLLVALFHSDVNKKNTQLIFTTHNTMIVNETEGIMRADQVWFAEKDKYGESELYSAQDFEDMSISVPFERWYRSGRFGALPTVGQLNSNTL